MKLSHIFISGICSGLLLTAAPTVAFAAQNPESAESAAVTYVDAPAHYPLHAGDSQWWASQRTRHLKPAKARHFFYAPTSHRRG